jgi:hypothetical protein
MLVHAHGFALSRGIADHVHVELDVRSGLPAFAVIGLGGGAARDARERVHAALLNSGFAFPRKRVTANLAPAVSARGAPAFDLVLACCVLASQDELDGARLARVGLFAELGLGGDLRPCEGVTAAAEAAGEAGLGGLIVARGDLAEARASRALPVAGLSTLHAVAELLKPQHDGNRRRQPGAAAVKARTGSASEPGNAAAGRSTPPATARTTNARAPADARSAGASPPTPGTARTAGTSGSRASVPAASTNGARGP